MSRYIQRALLLGLITCLLGLTNSYAEQNTLRAVDISRHGEQVFIRLKLDKSLAKAPTSFATLAPARIVLDLPDTTNATATIRKTVDMGEIRHIDIVQAGTRTRIVINLKRPVNHTTQLVDQEAQVLIGGATQPVASTTSSANKAASLALERNAVLDIDFRRGDEGAGRVIIDLAREQSAIDVRRQGLGIVIDLMKSTLPDLLKRRLDVKDFATPVQEIGASSTGDMVRITVTAGGQWDHIAWQTERRLVVEVKPQKTTERGNGRGYRGEKLSLNFQNIEVRALLQVIADFTGLNVVASDTVGGNLTLRLKDVPWDQALDIVMQARGLDMRKSGNVLWIAPKDELLTKERLELEQRAQINELEPLVTETFQLNYQKAEAFQKVFGLDGQAGRGSILSRRGSASAEPRSNKLFITDTPGKLEEVRRLIQMTDVPQRQVMIEARIVEADDSFNKNLGVRLGYADYNRDGKGPVGINLPGSARLGVTGNYLGVGEQTAQTAVTGGSYMPNTQFVDLPAGKIGTASPGSIGFSLFSAGANRFLNLELTALQADGKGKIISSPRVVTADQQPAIIEQGEEIPYQQATSSGATSVQFKKANLKLEVTPQITPDGNIILTVDVAKDSRGIAVGTSYAIDTKHVKTNVQVENGGTVVLGGIFTQEERSNIYKVPFFGDIPLLGQLFRQTSQLRSQKELLIFITPRIVADLAAAGHYPLR